MKRINIQVFILLLLFISGNCLAQKKKAPLNPLKTEIDSLSYAIGVANGAGFKNNLSTMPGGECNVDILLEGFNAAIKGKTTLMTPEESQQFLQTYFTNIQSKEAGKAKEEGAKFLEENKKKEGVHTTASGLQYKVLQEGNGTKPTVANSVKVHYKGTLIDGKEFDSSYQRGEPATFGVTQVIPGFSETLQLMSPGAKYICWIPSNLGYGDSGTGSIPAGSTLIFEVELLDIINDNSPSESQEKELSERMAGDYKKIYLENADDVFSYQQHSFTLTKCGLIVSDENNKEISSYEDTNCESSQSNLSFYVPINGEFPFIVVAESRTDNMAYNGCNVYLVDNKFDCKKIGVMRFTDEEGSQPFMKIEKKQDGMKFSFDTETVVFDPEGFNEARIPASDIYYVYTKGSLQPQGPALNLSCFMKDNLIKEIEKKNPGVFNYYTFGDVNNDGQTDILCENEDTGKIRLYTCDNYKIKKSFDLPVSFKFSAGRFIMDDGKIVINEENVENPLSAKAHTYTFSGNKFIEVE